ncbi:MAG: AMIN domain-containing protein [Gemmatimonadota bacterium]|nr:AMIN domain-containing protein [Gemmatimonadota bacterium]
MRRTIVATATLALLSAFGAPLSAATADAAVTAIRVEVGAAGTDVVLALDGDVTVSDFRLTDPHRIVVDLRGAEMRSGVSYDRMARGGVTNVRLAQYAASVVRVVVDLDRERGYRIVRGAGELRIAVEGLPGASVGTAVAAPTPTAAPTIEAPTPAQQRTQAARANFSFVDMPIREVIAAFASVSGKTFITGPTVEASVTAEIAGQAWDVALQKILQAYGFSAVEDTTGIITIDTYDNISKRSATEPLVSQIVSINYATAIDLATTLRTLLAVCSTAAGAEAAPDAPPGAAAAPAPGSCGRGTVAVDAKTNSVIITETVSRLPEIVRYVKELDRRTPQIAIRAKIISVDRSATEELGLSYDVGTAANAAVPNFQNALLPRVAGGGNFTVALGGDAFSGVANANRLFRSSSALSLIYTMAIGGNNLTTFLDALTTQQLSDIQAEPSTTTIDNREATLFAGTEQAFLLTPPAIPGQIQAVAPQIFRQKIGIGLDVTPHVTSNRLIALKIKATQQSLLSITEAGPSITERTATNEVLVADGETAVIAGLTQTQTTKLVSGIPILSNLPWVGRFFRQEREEQRKQDLLILVTPHIVDEGDLVRPPAP